MPNEEFALNEVELLQYHPNQFLFVLADRITKAIPGKTTKGYKNLINNEK